TQARIAGARGLKKYAREKFLPPGYKMADMQFSQIIAGKFFKLLHGFSNLILFRPLRDSLGLSNIRVCCSTGALLSPDVIRFYHALNIPLKSIYGSAETGILSCAVNSDIRLDTQGNVLQGIHVKITEEGELICQHPGIFLGYQTNETHGTDSVKGGWVYTGDTAKLTEDNHLIIIDRMNDIVELDTGDRLLPQSIESRLKFSPYIKDVWVLAGNKKQYITAFIVIYYDNVGKWADRRKITYTTFADLAQKKEVYELIKGEIVKFNTTLPPNLRIKKFVNLHREFEPDEGELTRNRKLRRSFLAERYNPLIKAIYEGTQEGTVASQIKYRDGSTGTVTAVIHIESIEEVS
ncbi:MAG TPA: AMP-binding protein, partial [Dehalococcoidia bacterium]|nr:AMP-binding protein [Dehalococcoidia bacterium]